jgi:hypothetical protein
MEFILHYIVPSLSLLTMYVPPFWYVLRKGNLQRGIALGWVISILWITFLSQIVFEIIWHYDKAMTADLPEGNSIIGALVFGWLPSLILCSIAKWIHDRFIKENKSMSMTPSPKLTLKDEMVLNIDGIMGTDPAHGLCERAKKFISSRQWTTPSIFYGDQPEPDLSKDSPMWGMCFCIGLDHVRQTQADWFSDVRAVIEFVQVVSLETGCEFIIEFRLKSRLWYSETLDFITNDTDAKVDFTCIRSMLEHFIGIKHN